MKLDQITSNLDIFMEHKGGINSLKDFFLSSAFRGGIISSTDLDGGLDLFRDLEIAGSNFDSSVKMSSSDLMGIWEGFSLYDLPESWKWMRLDQVGSIVGGGTPDTTNKSYWANGVGTPWITPADMRNQSMFIFGGKRNLTEIGLRESSSKLLPSNSVVFSSRAPIGYVGITGVPLATNQGFKSCVPFMPEMAKFIYFYLMFIGEEINRRATGTTFKEVSGKQFAATPIPVPPLRTQLIIVKMIEEFLSVSEEVDRKILHQTQLANFARKSAVDAISTAHTIEEMQIAWERIQQNWKVIAGTYDSIEDLRRLIETLGIRGQLSESIESGNTAEDLLKELNLGEEKSNKDFNGILPKNWESTNLGTVIQLEYGKSLPKQVRASNGQIPVYGSNGIVGYHDEALIETGAIVVGRKGSIGQANIARGKSWVIDTAYYVIPKGNMSLDYVALLIKTSNLEMLNKATAIPGLNRNDAYSQRCFLAPLEEQSRIVETVNELMEVCDRLSVKLRECESLAIKFARSVVSGSV
jgi:type I restriction enzyme S subunit